MKGEEKLEALLLEILEKLEVMSKKSGGGEQISPALTEILAEIKEMKKLQTSQLLIFKVLHEILPQISSAENLGERQTLAPAPKNYHYLWFFPDLKEWLALIRRGTWVITLAILFIFSASLLMYFYNDYSKNRASAEKYRFLFQKGAERGEEYYYALDSAWQIDDIRNEFVRWTEQKEDSIRAVMEKRQRVRELRQELDNLTEEKK